MSTITELCAAANLNPKVVRAKLRRAIKAGTLKVEHDHRASWAVTPAIATFLGVKTSQPKAKAKAAKAPAKKAA